MTKAERTKKFIIERVAPIFNRKGVYATSLKDLTEATGLTKGAIYGNFDNKDALALACFHYNLRFLQKGLYQSLALSGSTQKKMLSLIDFYRSHYDQIAEKGGCPLMNSAIEADDGYPLLKKEVETTFKLWEREIEGILFVGQQKREINQRLDLAQLATSFIAQIEGGILLAKSMDDPSYFFRAMENLELQVENL